MIVNYDLGTQLCTADFYGWMIGRAHAGATEIVFDTTSFRAGWPEGVARRRFDSIIAPGPAFLGLPSREGTDGDKSGPVAKTRNLLAFARANPNFRRLRSVLPPNKTYRYTVTIRDALEDKWRNSNRAAWERFARQIGALVIDDHRLCPFHWHDLMASYAGAEMNFGVNGGPLGVCSLSEYPCMMFNLGKDGRRLNAFGLQAGESLPWCRENQFTFWEHDEYANIIARFKQRQVKQAPSGVLVVHAHQG